MSTSTSVLGKIVADFDAIKVALGRALVPSMRRLGNALWRFNMTPGDRHIDRVCKEILAGKPGRPAEIRLIAASDFAQVLDGAR